MATNYSWKDFPAIFVTNLKSENTVLGMSLDNFLVIPCLSKELTLIGFPPLPYTLEKAHNTKSKRKTCEEALKIKFKSKLMIQALTSACFELVKQVKTFGVIDNNAMDKLQFENIKLEKQLKACKFAMLKKNDEVITVKEANHQLQEKVNLLEKKIRDLYLELKNLVKKNQIIEDNFKHALKKKELDLFNLHKSIWKQFNMADQNYLPETFKIVQLNQPNFSQLWSKVKYSDPQTREDILKDAVSIFQTNNKALVEESFSLKAFLLTSLQDTQDILKLMVEKMHLPDSVLFCYNNNEGFVDVEKFDASAYKNILNSHFKVIKRICELFDKVSFTVSDEIFVCWSNIIKDL